MIGWSRNELRCRCDEKTPFSIVPGSWDDRNVGFPDVWSLASLYRISVLYCIVLYRIVLCCCFRCALLLGSGPVSCCSSCFSPALIIPFVRRKRSRPINYLLRVSFSAVQHPDSL